ncbi:dihydrolipoamide acetyltransferase family protein [Dactylosporangium sp. NPDC005572]|uniref:dihydrolipoamide acetyltransferase family protein n=1 Tax=Dactylosporangium sp. NPDC005572 TaxID=3156889 RepID=UPI0033B976BF
MAELLRMPEIAANTEEAILAGWPVAEREPFAAGAVIATIETAKAAVDVEAPAPGVILRVLVAEGASVQVGDAIALIAHPDETVDDVDAALTRLGFAAAPAPVDVGAAVPMAGNGTAIAASGVTGSRVDSAGGRSRVFASPLARKLAREAGIAFETLQGSGPHGRVVRADVEAAIADRGRAVAPAPPSAAGSALTSTSASTADSSVAQDSAPAAVVAPVAAAGNGRAAGAAPAGTGLVPHSRLRRAIARRLTDSKSNVPHFYLRGSARVDALLALRAELNAAAPVKVSVNDLIVKAVAQAHTAVPAVNVMWTDDGMRVFPAVDLGIAVATDGGLVTPVLRAVDRMGVSQVAAAARDFAERAKQGGLKQDELEGGSATVTNLGMYGTEEFAAIINPPQSMILAVGAARREPVVTDTGDLAPATVLRVTLSVDHRAIDGSLAAQWMRAFVAILEQPLRIVC